MFTIIIQEKGGEQRRMVFNKPEVTIGRVQGNDIVLPKGNVSKRHARIVLKDGKFIIVDLKSTNGTYVNGRKITSPLVVKDSDKIYIGDFIVGVDEAASAEGDGPSETTTSPPGDRMVPPAPDIRPPRPTEAQPMPSMGAMPPAPDLRADPVPAPSAPPMASPMPGPRPGPPRPAPGGPAREPGPLGGPGAMPPLAPPDRAGPDRSGPGPRPLGRPGGTMPPPMAPIPPMAQPMSPSAGAAHADAGSAPMPMPRAPNPAMPSSGLGGGHLADGPSPSMREPMREAPEPARAPMPMASASPAAHSAATNGPSAMRHDPMGSGSPPGAQVVPLPAGGGAAGKRNLAGVGAKKVVGRSVSLPSRRGVQLEPLDPKVVKMLDLQSNILERLRTKLDIDKIPFERLQDNELVKRTERAIIDMVETLESSGELPKYIDQDSLIKETLGEALALGPLDELLADEKIDEIIIDRRDRVIVGSNGELRGSGKAFSSDEVFERVVMRLVAEANVTIDESNPVADVRLHDGTRVTAAVAPIAARGTCLVLKKAPTQAPQLSELVSRNALSSGMADFLATCVTARRNMLVCGSAGSGKTALLGAIAAASPAGERIVSIEGIAELAIGRDEWVQLETRPGTGKHSAIDLADLFETAIRLVPDRLVVGEIRGRESLPLVSALSTSLDGAVVGMTGEGAHAALGRLLTLARVAAPMASDASLRELVAQAFEIIIHVTRWSDGTTKVLAIEEVVGCTDQSFDTHILFAFRDNGFLATGTVPRFYAELEARGIPADQAVFR